MDNIAKTNKKTYFSIAVFVLLLALGSGFYFLGYRITDNFGVGKLGSLALVLPYADTSVYIDSSSKTTATKNNEELTFKLSPNNHTIIISKDGYFPWKKDVTIPSSGEVTFSPVFVPTSTNGEIITKDDKNYTEIKQKVTSNDLPTRQDPLYSKDQSTFMWVEDNAIVTQSGSHTERVIQPDTIIRNADFYKDRNDIVMFSIENAIYLIEASKEGGQNFMPIYRGQDPTFVKADDNSIYVFDNNILMQITI